MKPFFKFMNSKNNKNNYNAKKIKLMKKCQIHQQQIKKKIKFQPKIIEEDRVIFNSKQKRKIFK